MSRQTFSSELLLKASREHMYHARRKSEIVFKISPHLDAIHELVSQNRISAISAKTGSGKTLAVPPKLAEQGLRVACFLPTVVATTSAADFQEEHTRFKIGYAANRVIRYDDDCDIVYATTGHGTAKLLSLLKRKPIHTITRADLSFLGDVIMVDEVHSGTVQISLLIGLLRYLLDNLPDSVFHTKIVFTSATLNTLDVSRYFSDFPIYKVELERLPITHVYNSSFTNPLTDDPTPRVIEVIKQELSKMRSNKEQWHGIVFRPGVQEVEDMIQRLEQTFGDEIMIFPAYSELSSADLQDIFEEFGVPKVIVATNIVESSVTINNVGFIIDDGLVKRIHTNDTGGQKLVTAIVTQDAVIQRAGRTARTRAGTVYHLYTEDFWSALDKHQPLEIDRVPIFNVVLSLIDSGLEPGQILKISPERKKQAMRILQDNNMIEVINEKRIVTDAGQFVSRVNLGIYNAYMIYLAAQQYRMDHLEYPLRTAVALAVFLELYGPPPFYIPRRNRGQTKADYTTMRDVHIEKHFSRFMGATGIETLINLYWTMGDEVYDIQQYQRCGYLKAILSWSQENSMNNRKLKEIHNCLRAVMRSVAEYLDEDDILDEVESPSKTEMPVITAQTITLFKQAYRGNTFIQDKGDTYHPVGQEINQYRHKPGDYNTCKLHYPAVIAAQVMEIQGVYGTSKIIGLTVPVDLLD